MNGCYDVRKLNQVYRMQKEDLSATSITQRGKIEYCKQLKLKAADGKRYNTDVANTEQLLRIIQSIPSAKVEPFIRVFRISFIRVLYSITGKIGGL